MFDDNVPIIETKEIELLDFINKGASGSVYKAKYRDQKIICKCFHIERYYDYESLLEDVEYECKNYSYLINTNYCCKLIGICYSGHNIYLLLREYNVKGDLYDYINQDKLWEKIERIPKKNEYLYCYQDNKWIYKQNRKQKIKLTKHLCNSLEELHSKNMVHCDLKTNNILYNEKKDQLILIDFGASYYLGEEYFDIIDEGLGTLGYACNEFNENGYCCKKTDIYSIAICILEIWCGGIWGDGDTYKECRKEVLSSLRKLKKKEPQLVKELKKCIVMDVDKRPYIETFKKNIFHILKL